MLLTLVEMAYLLPFVPIVQSSVQAAAIKCADVFKSLTDSVFNSIFVDIQKNDPKYWAQNESRLDNRIKDIYI